MNNLTRKYLGTGKPNYESLGQTPDNRKEPYQAEKNTKLVNAVNLALFLKRPLLVEGDPGCGKTCLAYAVAYELGYPMFSCYVRSTTKARDLLYTFDQLERLYDIEQMRARKRITRLPSLDKYVKLNKLGKAIELSQNKKMPSVVLIDEVDKADIDFPNDLLQALDEWRFTVDETGREYNAGKPSSFNEPNDHLPLVIITSNQEKRLPAPFLRRCLYFYIEFPDQTTMEKIVAVHFGDPISPLFVSAVKKFFQLRKDSGIKWQNPPSTSQLITWIRALQCEEIAGKMTAKKLDDCSLKDLPCAETLVKNETDLKALKKHDR